MLVFFGAGVVYFVNARDKASGKKSIWSYLLIWPVIIDQHKNKATKNSNRFIAAGVIIMALLILVSMLIHPETR
jgi:hypothetical protein